MGKLLIVSFIMLIGALSAFPQDLSLRGQGTLAQINGHVLFSWWNAYERIQQDTNEQGDRVKGAMFIAYVAGVCDAEAVSKIPYFVLPSNVDANTVWRIVGKFLEAHPEELNSQAIGLVEEALSAVYPETE